MTTLIIHTGGGKCGSSAIQNYFQQLSKSFGNNSSIYYGPVSDHTRLLSLINPKKYLSLRGKKPIALAEQSAYQYLDSLRQNSHAKYVVVSSEFFASQTNKNLNRLISLIGEYINFSRVKVIQYVRSPESLYLSKCQQRIKADTVIVPFYNFSCNYSRLIRLKELDCDEIIVREFSRSSLVGEDVVRDFFSTAFEGKISIDQDNLKKSTITNESLSAESLNALQIYNHNRISSGLTVSMGRHTQRVIRLLRRFDGKHSQSIHKAALQPFISTFIILSHMPALKKAFEDYGLFADQVNQYNCNHSPITAKESDYFFDSRGSSFQDIRSILLKWDDQLSSQALGLLNSID